ncbi:MAG: hypothetical protein JSS20_00110 [Proteobacteria bacterium]|nr:hypothetical protein [Pseudomonadota bacterium]
MEIFLSREAIEERIGLAFIEGEDSLGRCVSTFFIDDELGPVTMLIMKRHHENPHLYSSTRSYR